MKILFLTPYLPSKRAGGENFTRLLLEDMAKSFDIDLVYFKYADDSYYQPSSKNIQVLKVVHNSLAVKLKNSCLYPFIHPIFSVRFDWKLLDFLKKKMQSVRYDYLYLDHSQMFLYGKFFPEIRKILMSHDVMAQRYSRMGNALNRKWVIKSEKIAFSFPDSTIFTFSEKDAAIVQTLYNKKSWVTNFFLDVDVVNAVPCKLERRVVLFGKWARADNSVGVQWFFDKVFAHIDKSIKVIIIGTGLSVEFLERLKGCENVEYRGFVDNPYQLIADSMFVISPLFSGAGVKVKVVEALACGTPVLGTSIAFEGIDRTFKEFMLEAESPEDYIRSINSLDINLVTRIHFKESFFKSYNKSSIVNFIKGEDDAR